MNKPNVTHVYQAIPQMGLGNEGWWSPSITCTHDMMSIFLSNNMQSHAHTHTYIYIYDIHIIFGYGIYICINSFRRGWKPPTRTCLFWRFFFGELCFSVLGMFFVFCFPASLLFCFLLFCFSLLVCFYTSLLLCFSTFLPLCFSAFLLFPGFLLFQLLCFFEFCFSMLFCFSSFSAYLLFCFSAFSLVFCCFSFCR